MFDYQTVKLLHRHSDEDWIPMTEGSNHDAASHDVECLYPDRRLAIPLGDLDAATPICNACTAAHIFRPDED